jgi:hypothetical protein
MLLLHELDPEIQGMSSHPLNSGLSNLVERPPFAKGALFGNRKALGGDS